MANFCSKCGKPIDVNTGMCPNCNPIQEPIYDEIKIEELQIEEPKTELLTAWMPEEQVVAQPEVSAEGKKKKGKGLTVFLTILFSVLFFITSIVAISVFTVRNTVKEENIEKVFSDLDVDDVLDAFSDTTGEDVSFDDEAAMISEHMYREEIAAEDFETFLEDSTIMDFVAEKLVQYVEDIRENDDDFSLDEKDIEKFLNENEDEFEEATGYDFSSEEIEAMAYRMMDFEAVQKIYPEEIKNSSPAIYYVLQIFMSFITLIVAAVLSVLLIVALLKNNVSQGFVGMGVVLTIQGGLLTLIALVGVIIPSVMGSITNELVGLVGSKLLSVNLLFFGAILAVGVFILVVRMLVRKVIAKKAQNKSA